MFVAKILRQDLLVTDNRKLLEKWRRDERGWRRWVGEEGSGVAPSSDDDGGEEGESNG